MRLFDRPGQQSQVDLRYLTAAFDTFAFICFICHWKAPPSRASPVRKAPCCNGFKPTSNSNKHIDHFYPLLPSGTEDEDPATSKYWFWHVLAFQPCTTMEIAVGKSW